MTAAAAKFPGSASLSLGASCSVGAQLALGTVDGAFAGAAAGADACGFNPVPKSGTEALVAKRFIAICPLRTTSQLGPWDPRIRTHQISRNIVSIDVKTEVVSPA